MKPNALLLVLVTAAAGCTVFPQFRWDPRGLEAFGSEAELSAALERAARHWEDPYAGEEVEVGLSESVTNVQHEGVDEGGIVKVHGDHLVVLRRGRLFTVRIGDSDLRAVSAVDVFPPGLEKPGVWYDELLVTGDDAVVIGYSYADGATEIGRFRIYPDGRIEHRDTYHLRSNDYYSSRNYSSRLVQGRLFLFTQVVPPFQWTGLADALPALRRWHPDVTAADYHPVMTPQRVFRARRKAPLDYAVVLHTVLVCDVAEPILSCESTAVLGPQSSVFYVSPTAAYVAAAPFWWNADAPRTSLLYRIPLDGSAPGVLRVEGSPVDQFSFLERDGWLYLTLLSGAWGSWMWDAEEAAGDVALLSVPVSTFSDGGGTPARRQYRGLPRPDNARIFRSRFVGEALLYGVGGGWWRRPADEPSVLHVAPIAGGEVARIDLAHGVDRIEVMDSMAVVVGSDGKDLHFAVVRVSGSPAVVHSYVRPSASQGELRSHGFFYRPDGLETGLLGLPIRGPRQPGYRHLFERSARVLYLRNEAGRLYEMGELTADDLMVSDDGCVVSCVDWYGNARPLFLRGRIFALLGYELVEGEVMDGQIREARRTSFAPRRLASPVE